MFYRSILEHLQSETAPCSASATGYVGVAELHACTKNVLQKRFGTKDSVCCSEFGDGRFSEVANVLQVWDFQSVTRALSALGGVSASRSIHSGRFSCSI